jgi:hypothetical protein
VGKKERTMGERVTGKDRYIRPELFFRCRTIFMFMMGKKIGRFDHLKDLSLPSFLV